MKNITFFCLLFLAFSIISCTNNENSDTANDTYLIVRFKFDPTQIRLNNQGFESVIPATNAAQTPVFNSISAHYFELTPLPTTQFGAGTVLYHAPETTIGGATAIDFSQSKIVREGEEFLKIPLKQVAAGTYQYVRVSLSYQNYMIWVRNSGVDYTGTLASFLGFNTYITTHSIGNNTFLVNANKLQGYWAFALDNFPYSSSGNSTGTTTVPNPLFASSIIPPGSCVVTGKFENDLVISGNETKNITVTLSLSINKSFEWKEVNFDGKYEPSIHEDVVDMGIRGLIPSYFR